MSIPGMLIADAVGDELDTGLFAVLVDMVIAIDVVIISTASVILLYVGSTERCCQRLSVYERALM